MLLVGLINYKFKKNINTYLSDKNNYYISSLLYYVSVASGLILVYVNYSATKVAEAYFNFNYDLLIIDYFTIYNIINILSAILILILLYLHYVIKKKKLYYYQRS